MSKYVDEERLLDAIKAFYTITKLKITVYSSNQEVIMEYPKTNSKLCNFLHNYEYCKTKCVESNYKAFLKINQVNQKAEPYIYTCYAGLIEAIVPLRQNNETIGYVMFGQVTNSEDKDSINVYLDKLKSIINVDEAKKYVPSIEIHNNDLIKAEANLLEICSKYFIQDDIVRKKDSNILDRVTSFINIKKFNNFSIDELCDYVNISRTKLYTLFKREFKVGIAEYVRNLKIEEAKRLLIETNYSINKIAKLVDVSDANSFIKIFKKQCNKTPLEYRISSK